MLCTPTRSPTGRTSCSRAPPTCSAPRRPSRLTSLDFTSTLADRGIKISLDGRGSWRDNVFVERLWRSIKYEEVYLHTDESVSRAKAGIGCYIEFYFASLPALPKAA